jgi:8-oxo-dGTP diphosphatase
MPTLATLVYCLHETQVLLIQRRRNPFAGFWIAPGGKLELGESPNECATRELLEETGLTAQEMLLRAIITETSPRPDWQWLLFVFALTRFTGSLRSDQREGELSWWPVSEFGNLKIPDADRIFFERSIDLSARVYEAKFIYDEQLQLLRVIEGFNGDNC